MIAKRVRVVIVAVALTWAAASPAGAFGVTDVLTAPATLIERAVEARAAGDIVKDNEIVLKVNKAMAEVTSIKAATEIYEQRLLITGLFDDKAVHDAFRKKVEAIAGVRKLYWHVVLMTAKEQERNKDKLIAWDDAIVLDAKVGASLVGTRGVADVNFRATVDSHGAVYLLGRARSAAERDKALQVVRGVNGVRKVVDYVEVRP